MNFLSQAGLPLIKAGIEEAWLEGRGELTDDQVCIFDIIFPFSGDWFELCVNLSVFLKKSLKFSFFYLVQLVDSTQKNFDSTQNSLQVAAIVEWELSVTPEQGGQLAEQVFVLVIVFFFGFVFVFVLTPEQGGGNLQSRQI